MPYSMKEDLLLGDIPLPTFVNASSYVNDAAAEMDSWLGRRYVTPLALSESDALQRPHALTLRRINNHLATGRLILAISAGSENIRLHAYGNSLVKDALSLLRYFANPNTELIPGAIPHSTSEDVSPSGPLILNAERHSLVDSFYEATGANPMITSMRLP